MTLVDSISIRRLGRVAYLPTLEAMRSFTSRRDESSADELWLLEHPPVYTLGQGAEHGPVGNGIPLARSDRGGDITYHGPGQLVVYTLVDLARRGIKVRQFVALLEQAVIDLLAGRGERRAGAPGVYVNGAKIAALGIRVRQGRAYHGLSLNVDMDLSPFRAIDPCGYPGLEVTQLRALGIDGSVVSVGERLAALLVEKIENA
jgi:lipoyl(octanoyl) transferase